MRGGHPHPVPSGPWLPRQGSRLPSCGVCRLLPGGLVFHGCDLHSSPAGRGAGYVSMVPEEAQGADLGWESEPVCGGWGDRSSLPPPRHCPLRLQQECWALS